MNAANAPMAYLQTAGPAADPVTRLGWGLGLVSIAVVIVIAALLLVAMFRKRTTDEERTTREGRMLPIRHREGLAWLVVGTGISSVILFACAVWTLATLAAIAKPPSAPRVTVEVRGYQYWWRVRYLDADGVVLATTANEIHIPAGEPVRFRLSSGDVIHSFWVPALGGKMDAIPGQTNVTWLQADRPGRYRGQCSEYCGAQHAHMALFVDADAPGDFTRWIDAQRVGVVAAAEPAPSGRDVFAKKCAGCHAVRGTSAAGPLAPDLTHLMARRTLAAGTLANDADGLRRWLEATQDVKPGSEMPTVAMEAGELDAVVAYLETLR